MPLAKLVGLFHYLDGHQIQLMYSSLFFEADLSLFVLIYLAYTNSIIHTNVLSILKLLASTK